MKYRILPEEFGHKDPQKSIDPDQNAEPSQDPHRLPLILTDSKLDLFKGYGKGSKWYVPSGNL